MRLDKKISTIALGGLLTLGSLAAQAGPLTSAGSMPASSFGLMSSSATTDLTFDVTGIFSVDGSGDADNQIRHLQIGANARVIGIGWAVTLFADRPSFLSEMVVGVGSSTTRFANLTPGVADRFAGTQSYSSGIVDLVASSLDFAVGADGKLRLEFYESFDDFANDWDGRWLRGSLTFRVEDPNRVPEPPVYALVFLGLAVAAGAARLRARP